MEHILSMASPHHGHLLSPASWPFPLSVKCQVNRTACCGCGTNEVAQGLVWQHLLPWFKFILKVAV